MSSGPLERRNWFFSKTEHWKNYQGWGSFFCVSPGQLPEVRKLWWTSRNMSYPPVLSVCLRSVVLVWDPLKLVSQLEVQRILLNISIHRNWKARLIKEFSQPFCFPALFLLGVLSLPQTLFLCPMASHLLWPSVLCLLLPVFFTFLSCLLLSFSFLVLSSLSD